MWLALKLLAAVIFYGAAIEPRLVDRNDERASIPNLPAAWEDQQIAVFADLQVGMWWGNSDAVRRIVDDVVRLRPAVVLIAGDFVYEGDVHQRMKDVLSLLEPLVASGIPTYGVLGNHDYSLMNEHSEQENAVARRVRVALDSVGIRILDNRSIVLAPPGRAPGDSAAPRAPSDSGDVRLYLVGIGDKWARNDHIERAFAEVPANAPRIVFMHDPDSYVRIPAGAAPLAIAAHTHAMQLNIPFLSDWYWRNHVSEHGLGLAGWVDKDGKDGNRLYVNRGIGFSIVPVRINAVPELTVFKLERQRPDTAR